ncbi:MAG: hypothetical protein DRG63_02720, partial [Deltaproteobacteria bacterium]
ITTFMYSPMTALPCFHCHLLELGLLSEAISGAQPTQTAAFRVIHERNSYILSFGASVPACIGQATGRRSDKFLLRRMSN